MDSTSKPTGIPAYVREYARKMQFGDKVIEAWHLHFIGGLNAVQCAKRLNVSIASCRNWLRALRKLEAADKQPQDCSAGQETVDVFDPDSLARARAQLYREAVKMGAKGMGVRAKILDGESRRLHLDGSTVDQRTLVVQLALAPPEERRAEITERIAALQQRGHLPSPPASDDSAGDNTSDNVHVHAPGGTAEPSPRTTCEPVKGTGAPPHGPPITPYQSLREPSTSNFSEAEVVDG